MINCVQGSQADLELSELAGTKAAVGDSEGDPAEQEEIPAAEGNELVIHAEDDEEDWGIEYNEQDFGAACE